MDPNKTSAQEIVAEQQGTPRLSQAIRDAIDTVLMGVHTTMPGTVVSYNPTTGTAEIQPNTTKQLRGQAAPTVYPIIPNVPVVFMGPANGWMRWPLKKGDPVLLHFAERALDQWFTQGGTPPVLDSRKFDLTDAIAIPGLRTRAGAIVPKGASTSAELAFGDAWIEITADGKFKVENAGGDLKSILSDIVSMMQAAASSPTGGPLIFTFPNPAIISNEITHLFE